MSQTTSSTSLRSYRRSVFLIISVLLFIVIVLAVGIGAVPLSPSQVLASLGRGLTGSVSSNHDVIVWELRLPRVLCAAVVGATLALSGACYQGIFRNALADPYLLGVASGAGLGAALAIVFSRAIPFSLPLSSFVFALVTVIAVMALARQDRRLPLTSLVLAGVVVGSLCSAGTSFVMLVDREATATVLAWLLGSFSLSSWQKFLILAPLLLVTLFLTSWWSRAFNLLQLGDEGAAQLGLEVEKFKWAMILLSTLLIAVAVATAGVIGFVGLVMPHAVRLLFGADYRNLVPLCSLLGAMFMVLADLLARTLIAPSELPVGIITALVGAPFFLYVLRRQGRGL